MCCFFIVPEARMDLDFYLELQEFVSPHLERLNIPFEERQALRSSVQAQ